LIRTVTASGTKSSDFGKAKRFLRFATRFLRFATRFLRFATRFLRFATRYEKLREMYLGVVHLVLRFIRLRKLNNVNTA
jgi:hypothetical protein